MAVKGQATKNRLMDIAERLILNNGFTAMSIEEVIKDAVLKICLESHNLEKDIVDKTVDDALSAAKELSSLLR